MKYLAGIVYMFLVGAVAHFFGVGYALAVMAMGIGVSSWEIHKHTH